MLGPCREEHFLINLMSPKKEASSSPAGWKPRNTHTRIRAHTNTHKHTHILMTQTPTKYIYQDLELLVRNIILDSPTVNTIHIQDICAGIQNNAEKFV